MMGARFDKYNKYTVQNCNYALSAYVNPYSFFFLVINNLTFSISFYMTSRSGEKCRTC